jgi:hypothetical protein
MEFLWARLSRYPPIGNVFPYLYRHNTLLMRPLQMFQVSDPRSQIHDKPFDKPTYDHDKRLSNHL